MELPVYSVTPMARHAGKSVSSTKLRVACGCSDTEILATVLRSTDGNLSVALLSHLGEVSEWERPLGDTQGVALS